jgi:hypothetical protein
LGAGYTTGSWWEAVYLQCYLYAILYMDGGPVDRFHLLLMRKFVLLYIGDGDLMLMEVIYVEALLFS